MNEKKSIADEGEWVIKASEWWTETIWVDEGGWWTDLSHISFN